MTQPAPPAPPSSETLPLPLAALIGAVVGLLTGLAGDGEWFTKAPALTAGGLATLWTLGLGTVFLHGRPQQRGTLVLAVLLGVLGAVQGNLGTDTNTMGWPVLGVLGGAGLLLLSGWEGGKRWNPRLVPPFTLHSLLSFLLAGILGSLFYALLTLAAGLVETVGLRGMTQWLNKPVVMLPLLLGASAFFVAAIRAQPWGLALTRTLANVLGLLLPVAAVIVLLFAAVLPIAALQDTAKLYQGLLSSSLYLTLSVIFAGLTLAAFSARPVALPAAVQTLSRFGAYLLPLYPGLALYGLSVRVGQYGLTEDRLLGLVGAIWLLLTALGLALTRRRPAFAGLSRVTGLSFALLAGLTLLLSLPGLRPLEWSARSQAARLTRPDLTKRQSAEIVAQLAYDSGTLGKRLLDRVPDTRLSEAARNQRTRTRNMTEQAFKQQNVWGQSDVTAAEFTLSPGSLPISDAQRTELRRIIETKKGVYVPYPYFAHALPFEGGSRVLVSGRGNWYSGVWVDFDEAGEVVRHGTFTPLQTQQRDGVRWNENPFDASTKSDTITLPVVKASGATLLLDEMEPSR